MVDDRIPDDLLEAIERARQVRGLGEINFSNGSGPYSPTWDHLEDLIRGVEDDPTVEARIKHRKVTGRIP